MAGNGSLMEVGARAARKAGASSRGNQKSVVVASRQHLGPRFRFSLAVRVFGTEIGCQRNARSPLLPDGAGGVRRARSR
jgi:hypothetical protein